MNARKEPQIGSSRRHNTDDAKDWTNATEAAPAEPAEETQKMSLQMPVSVHARVKAGAALLRKSMLAVIVEMCRARFMGDRWPDDVVEQVKAQIAAEAEQAAPASTPRARSAAAPKRQAG